ncbi:hypothetical protein VPNG_08344 [Cytospora leucostoma]|uniref:Uncharacterized protein n=1 Tax=Cytospora leucostoma TaxID=1230097 RepID=A0A423W9Q1_9PEZI|nr:hypothetical protein VPNG_08344 [Cytospora leucostoma]
MSSQKTPLSASKRAVPIKIQILNLADRDSFPYTSVEARWSFTMNLMPLTKIKELCLHTAGQVKRLYNAVVDGTRLEARDRDGHMFHGQETISEEILNGETIFLIEGALGKAGEGTGKGTGKERGRLLSLQSEAEQAYRTPSVSSRSSSASRRRAKSQPRLTPSQRVLAIAQSGAISRSEPKRARSTSSSVLGRQALPSPPRPTFVKPAAASRQLSKGNEDASTAIGDDEPIAPKQENPVVKTSVVLSPQGARSPKSSPQLQDSQEVVPDSQDLPSGSPLAPASVSRAKSVPAIESKPNASEPSPVRARSAPRLDTLEPEKLHGTPTTTKTLTSRPDPYDISTVLSDNENRPPRRSASIMSSPIRKLGSASKRRAPASQPPLRQPHSNTNSPARTSKSAIAHGNNPVRNMNFMSQATPTRITPRPIKTEASSPLAVLPSSPTNNVAAAIAKGRNKIKRQPIPEVLVIDDSASEIDEELFRNPPGLSASTPSLEAPLHWSQPPLRATQDVSLGGVRPVSHRRNLLSGPVGATAESEDVHEDDEIINSKADVRRLIDAAKMTLAAASGSSKLKANALPSSAVSPLKLDSPVKTPPKRPTVSPAGKTPTTQAANAQPVVTIRGSSSEDESDEVGGETLIVKPELSNDDAWKDLPPAAPPGSLSNRDQNGKVQATEVIELSSNSESSIDPSWLDDYDAELPPVFDEVVPSEPFTQEVERPAPVVPVPASNDLATDPIEPTVNETPPSAQPDKRKRTFSDEPDSEDERAKKRLKRAEKKAARKAARRLRKQEKIARIEEERARIEEERARIQEERKRLALEQARRRALELEMVVSSPSRAKQADNDDAEADQDSAVKLETSDEDEDVKDIGVSRNGGKDSNSPRPQNTADGPNRLHSKRSHLPSPENKQERPDGSVDAAHLKLPATGHAHTQQKEQQQHPDTPNIAEKQCHTRPCDDWAALEATLGSGILGYSPLEVHNRIHLAMMHRSLPAPEERSHAGTDNANSDAVLVSVKAEPGEDRGPKPPRSTTQLAKDVIPANPPSTRARAPSPKDTTAAPQASSTSGKKKGKPQRSKARRHDRNRKRLKQMEYQRGRGYHKKIRELLHPKKTDH